MSPEARKGPIQSGGAEVNILPQIRIFGPRGEYFATNPNFWPLSQKFFLGVVAVEQLPPFFLDPTPLLNAKLIRFGPLFHKNPGFSL